MFRSPQALLASLLLHGLIGGMMLYLAFPKIVRSEESIARRCSIMLSRVVPVMPEMVREVPVPVTKPVEPKPVNQVKAVPKPKPIAPVKKIEKPAPVVEKKVEPLPAAQQETAEEKASETVETVTAERVWDEAESAIEIAAVPPAPAQSPHSYLNEHLAEIARLLQEYLYYPRMARKRHIEGEVLASFTLKTDGTVSDVTVVRHARAVLDRAAVRTIESLSGRLPHPQTALTLEVPIRFVLK